MEDFSKSKRSYEKFEQTNEDKGAEWGAFIKDMKNRRNLPNIDEVIEKTR